MGKYFRGISVISFFLLCVWLLSAATFYGSIKPGIQDTTIKGVKCTVYIPKNFRQNQKYPAVVALHPHDGTGAEDYIDYWTKEADRRGYVVICPESKAIQEDQPIQFQGWNSDHMHPPDDEERLTALLPALSAKYNIQSRKIVLTGDGNFVFILGLNNPDLFSAVVPINGRILLKQYPNNTSVDQYDTGSVNATVASVDKQIKYSNRKEKQIPVLMVNGKGYPGVHEEDIVLTVNKLKGFGYDVESRVVEESGGAYDPSVPPVILDWFEKKKVEEKLQ